MEEIKSKELSIFKPITLDDKETNGNIKPEVKVRMMFEIEEYLNNTKHLSIREVADGYQINWLTAKNLVKEVLKKWNEEDREKYNKGRHILMMSIEPWLLEISRQDKAPTELINSVANTLRTIRELEKQEAGDVNNIDLSKTVEFHFKDIKFDSSMLAEIMQTKNKQ